VLGQALAVARSYGGASPVLDEETIVGNVLQMQDSGTADLSALLTWVVKHLGDHSIWVERLHDEARAAGGAKSLAERVIRESLRLEQSEFLSRRVTREFRFRGYRMPKGWRVRICVREAHRSPDVFQRPTEFDPDRFLRNAHPLTEYAPFGLDRHRCLAARLVPRIGGTFVEELARGYRLTIVQDGPRQHGRFHWQPSRRLRVKLERHSVPSTPTSLSPLPR
jgi:ent-kaurenoic acid hydroxylase